MRVHLDLQVGAFAAVKLADLLFREDRLAVLESPVDLWLKWRLRGRNIQNSVGQLALLDDALTFLVECLVRKELRVVGRLRPQLREALALLLQGRHVPGYTGTVLLCDIG